MITYIHMTGDRKKVLRPISKLDEKTYGKRIALIFEDMVVTEGKYIGTERMNVTGVDHGEFVRIKNSAEGCDNLESIISTRNICGWISLEDGETAEDMICKEINE